MRQRTVASSFAFTGVGLHTGQQCRVQVRPAPEGAGRTFISASAAIPADIDHVVSTERQTVLGIGDATVGTVEHLLAALYACDVDNADIHVDGPEIPILDGSAVEFLEAIHEAGVVEQDASARYARLCEPCHGSHGMSDWSVTPADCLHVEVETEFTHWPEGAASCGVRIAPDTMPRFRHAIAPARTFAFRSEVEALFNAGLARGGSHANALVITPPDGFEPDLRLPQEWCRHKVIDVLGDVALIGTRLLGNVRVFRPGHTVNTLLARELRAGSRETVAQGVVDGS